MTSVAVNVPPPTGASGASTNTSIGSLGYRTATISVGGGLFYTVTGTSADLWWVAGGGTLQCQVDGGPVQTIDTAGTYRTDQRTTISLGAAGSHNVAVGAAGSSVGFSGMTVYNGDAASGVTVVEAARSGAKTADFLQDSTAYLQALAAVVPQLVTVEMMGNDALQSIPPATFAANLQTLINGALAAASPAPSVLVVIPYTPAPGLLPGGVVWADYVAAASSTVAGYLGRVRLLRLSDTMPQTDTTGTGLYRSDGLHPNDTGQVAVADAVMAAVTPPSASVTMPATSTLAAAPQVGQPASVTMASSSGMSAAPSAGTSAVVTMTASSTTSATGTGTTTAPVEMAATSDLAVSGSVTGRAAVTMTAPSSLTATGSGTAPAAVTMSSSSGLDVQSSGSASSPAAMGSKSTLTVTGQASRPASVGMAAVSTLTATGSSSRSAPVTIAAVSALAASGSGTATATVTLPATSTLSASSTAAHTAAVTMAGSSSITVTGAAARPAPVAMASSSGLTLVTLITREAAITMTAAGGLAVSGRVDQGATVVMASAGELAAASRLEQLAVIVMTAVSGLDVAGIVLPEQPSGPSVHFVGGPYVQRLQLTGPLIDRRNLAGPLVARLHLTGPEVR